MRAVWLGVPEEFLEERHRLGHDRRDELWEGELHMVPPGSYVHGSIATGLVVALSSLLRQRGLIVRSSEIGLFEPGTNKSYRVPDVTVARSEQVSARGFEGAVLVIEVLSPDDESREKFPFYARVGVEEVWLIEPNTRALEVHALREGTYEPVAFVDGRVRSPAFGISLEVITGPLLQLRDGERIEDV